MVEAGQIEAVRRHIAGHWTAHTRNAPAFSGTVLPLPLPYTVPCMTGFFQMLFYWDTYFTNLGLIRVGELEQARNNTGNLLHEVEHFGFVPNCNHVDLLNRSQPPYLSMMVHDIFDETGDREWLAAACAVLEKEYDFWMSRRTTPCGLNRYYHQATADELLAFFPEIAGRLGYPAGSDDEKIRMGSQHLAEAESGWDFNPRFSCRCADHAPVDLNANLFVYETNFAEFSRILGTGREGRWLDRAHRRRLLMNRLMWDEAAGLFLDYDFINDRKSPVWSAASFHPLWARLASPEQASATRAALAVLEYDYGVAACCRNGVPRATRCQWDFPNGWAPLYLIAIEGLRKYGYFDDARRIAAKYVRVVTENFVRTQELWEKYNVVDGSTHVADEYPMPPMMGWTAGVFLCAADLVRPVAS